MHHTLTTSFILPRRSLRYHASAPRSQQRSSTSTTLLTASPRHLLRVAPPNDDRPPRGAITGRLPGASMASTLRPCSDTNCWVSPTDRSHQHITNTTHSKSYSQGLVSCPLFFFIFSISFSVQLDTPDAMLIYTHSQLNHRRRPTRIPHVPKPIQLLIGRNKPEAYQTKLPTLDIPNSLTY